MAHPIVHVEIPAADRAALSEFYKNIFGWTLTHNQAFDYMQFNPGEGADGAFVGNQSAPGDEFGWAGAGPNSPIVYIGTEDVPGDLAKIEAAGGQVLMPAMEIPGVGWMGLFRDPSGNHMGLFHYTTR
jgi:predicted enzyme related to lactoylglutathione lyase